MVKWEYKILELNSSNQAEKMNEETLNSMGQEGWELIAVTDNYGLCGAIAYLKRRGS